MKHKHRLVLRDITASQFLLYYSYVSNPIWEYELCLPRNPLSSYGGATIAASPKPGSTSEQIPQFLLLSSTRSCPGHSIRSCSNLSLYPISYLNSICVSADVNYIIMVCVVPQFGQQLHQCFKLSCLHGVGLSDPRYASRYYLYLCFPVLWVFLVYCELHESCIIGG